MIELARHSDARVDLLRTAFGHGETESVTACEVYLGGIAQRLGAEDVGNGLLRRHPGVVCGAR